MKELIFSPYSEGAKIVVHWTKMQWFQHDLKSYKDIKYDIPVSLLLGSMYIWTLLNQLKGSSKYNENIARSSYKDWEYDL